MRFCKAHAYGNDFLYVEQAQVRDAVVDRLAREMCDRHEGIGADGLIVYERIADDALSMRLFNADGSRAEVSGNGVRALAALALLDDARAGASLTIETEAGPKVLTHVGSEGTRLIFRTSMGPPRDIRHLALAAASEALSVVTVDMGNPHAVVVGPLPDEARFRRLGAALERHAAFPHGSNVEFASVEAADRVRVLIWERGVGPTHSSGTGSCAALVAAASFGGAARQADVVAPGGAQRVDWEPDSVYLTGWAEVLCVGEWLRQIPRTP